MEKTLLIEIFKLKWLTKTRNPPKAKEVDFYLVCVNNFNLNVPSKNMVAIQAFFSHAFHLAKATDAKLNCVVTVCFQFFPP